MLSCTSDPRLNQYTKEALLEAWFLTLAAVQKSNFRHICIHSLHAQDPPRSSSMLCTSLNIIAARSGRQCWAPRESFIATKCGRDIVRNSNIIIIAVLGNNGRGVLFPAAGRDEPYGKCGINQNYCNIFARASSIRCGAHYIMKIVMVAPRRNGTLFMNE